jgi:regulatory protein YycI of two-component signal transduction system YycFG
MEKLEKRIREVEERTPKELLEWMERPTEEGEIETSRRLSERLKEVEELKERVKKIEEEIESQREKVEVKEEVLPEIEPKIKIEKLPKRPSKFLRFLTRVLILIFFLIFALALIWFFISKKSTKEIFRISPPPPIEKEITKPEIFIPPSLISVEEERVLEIEKQDEIKEKISEEMEKEIEEGKIARIIIKNLAENRLASLKEILDSFEISYPEETLEKVEDFTLGIYSQKEGKRIVLVAKIKEGGSLEELKEWEGRIEREGLFVSGKKIQTVSKKFDERLIGGEKVRFLTISKNDLGICYSQIENYFIFSESLNGMEKVIEKIKK